MRNIVAIFAFIQCCYAETVINSAEEFQHFVYETGWRANAGYYDKNKQKDKWYSAKIYEKSIYKVIPQAIADCMQKKAEFSNVGEIVTFKANDHTKYSDENWNAVVLWNYLEYVIHNGGALSNDGVDKVGKKLKTYYAQDYWDYINKAVNDIQTYAKDLNLYNYIAAVHAQKKDNKYYRVTQEFDETTKDAVLYLKVCNQTLYIQNGKVSEEVAKQHTVPTSVNQIHALPNFAHIFNEKHIDISANKCWFNSVMLNLYNSETFHKVINELQSKSTSDKVPSYWIKQIFNDIRTGNMTKYGDHLKGLINATYKPAELNHDIQQGPQLGLNIITNNITKEGENYMKDFYMAVREEIKCDNACSTTIDHLHKVVLMSEKEDFTAAITKHDNKKFKPRLNTKELCSHCGKMAYIYTKNAIQSMPPLLAFRMCNRPSGGGAPTAIEVSERLTLRTTIGEYTYRLIGCVDEKFSGHVVAKIKCDNVEWVEVNDYPSPKVTKIKFDKLNKERVLVFYEKIS